MKLNQKKHIRLLTALTCVEQAETNLYDAQKILESLFGQDKGPEPEAFRIYTDTEAFAGTLRRLGKSLVKQSKRKENKP